MTTIPHFCVSGSSLPDAYHKAIVELFNHGAVVQCPDWNTQCMEGFLVATIDDPLAEPMISGLSICDPYSLEKYRMEMLDGLLDWSIEAGLEPYTYHARIEAQEDAVVRELQRSVDSRRAAVVVRNPRDYELDDAPCLQHLQFMIRGNALHSFVLFRSNDAAKAAFMNAFALALFQERIADRLGVSVGSMTYTANSFHCYQRDWPMLSGYVRAIEGGNPPTYCYAGEWKEMMDGERDKILADVKAQKERAGVR